MKKIEHLHTLEKHQRGLVIGIGGCGAEVLASNRRRMIGKYGTMENVPMVRYLYIDTDPKWWKEHKSRVDKSVRLSEPEFVDIQLPAAEELFRGIRRGNFPHYAWFDVQKLENLKNVVDGAGTVRQMARLAFWQNYTRIREKIEAQINALKPDSVATYMRTRHGIQLDEGITVYIVAGLGGGTGSGLWLETAYLVQKVLRDMGIPGVSHLVGYGILPQAFKDLTGANAMANGYAVLKELNYYSYRYAPDNQLASVFGEPEWDADYQRDKVNRVNFKRQAPFEFTYLLDSRNAYVDLHRKDIFHMIDCAIFHEFVGNFATYKRSLRCNVKNQLIQNDRSDCPSAFMSFGQSAALVPMQEIKQVLAHKLALQAVQEWIDKKAQPIKPLGTSDETTGDDLAQSVVGSIRAKAGEQTLVGAVRGWLLNDFMKAQGLNQAGFFATVVKEHQERLTDLPYTLAEAVKKEWVTETWDYNTFTGRVTNAWEKWRTDFNDEGADRMRWGEHVRKLVANKATALQTYKKILREEAYRLFEDSGRFGPAWAVCSLQQLKSGLGALNKVFLNEANNANAIANALGDTFLIDSVAKNRGPSLTSAIERKIGEDLERLKEVARSTRLWGKRQAVSDSAYAFLRSCALWCRARVEERARRESADMLEQLIQFLGELEAELIGHATKLATLEGELVTLVRAWNQKAMQTENVGALLYDAGTLDRLEAKLREMRGDHYSASVVARKALDSLGGRLRDLRQDQEPALLAKLVEAALEAVGDLNETGLADTEFAAHDLLSAAHRSDDMLDGAMKEIIRKSEPYVRFTPAMEDGGWDRSDLLPVDGAGLRGGGFKENDPDQDHLRVVESLARCGWNIQDGVWPVEDGNQIMLFKECGGFPLRALQGVAEMKEAYDQHRQQPNTTPLHILRDEMAECFPDLYPPHPETLERARLVQTVAVPLGFITLRDFPSLNGTGKPSRQYAFLRHIQELGEIQPVPVGRSIEAVGMKLAGNPELLAEIESVMSIAMGQATDADKARYAGQLRQYLAQRKEAIKAEAPGLDVESMPAYRAERDRVLAFLRKYALAAGTSVCAQGVTQRVNDMESVN